MGMREYGRHVQRMVDHLMTIEDKAKRQEQAQVVIELMGFLNPSLKNIEDYKHKLWDHLFFMSNFKLDVDSPYPIPTKETYKQKPDPLPYPQRKIKYAHLGKNLELVIDKAMAEEDQEKKKGFEYNRTQKEEKKFNSTGGSSVPVDMDNKGIGPIKSVDFGRSVDNSMAEQGKTIFSQKCTACHMAERKLIGPAMKGIYERRSPEWVMNMLLNPAEMLKQDPIAKALLEEYNNVMMLNQNLSQEEARSISEYLRTL